MKSQYLTTDLESEKTDNVLHSLKPYAKKINYKMKKNLDENMLSENSFFETEHINSNIPLNSNNLPDTNSKGYTPRSVDQKKIDLHYAKDMSSYLRNLNDYAITEGDKANEDRLFKFDRKPYLKYNPVLDAKTPTEMPLIENPKWSIFREK